MEISKGVKVPAVKRTGPKRKYPFPEMDIGDSISFEQDELFDKARRAATLYGKRSKPSKVFTSRKGIQIINDEARHIGAGGTIWRVE